MSLRTQLTRRARIAVAGVAAAGVAAAAFAFGPAQDDDAADLQVVAAQDVNYGGEPEADGSLVTRTDGIETMAASTITRDQMIARARTWLTANNGKPVPYSMSGTWGGYRRDCSGYVSMALSLGKPGLNTVGLATTRSATQRLGSVGQLKKGDLLIDYNDRPGADFRHVVIFEKWANYAKTAYWAYEQRGTYGTTHRILSYGIGQDDYDPYRPVKFGDGSGGGSAPAPAPGVSWPVLKSGSQGADVRSAQYLLKASGHQLDVDGSFGPKTRSAVVAFQRSRALAADGVIGPNTWAKLIRTVKSGSTGSAVKAAQIQLNVYNHGLSVDGSFGTKTRSATLAFQKNHRLAADGVIGPNTWRTLLGSR
ncbi:peptidoglycan-binding protein [Streptomyces sp. NPDC047130]|uniref:C40 family peptidase n=1 Tax=Streptomyces sp. NPDC047130 TaxID=3155261 RepID=UPI0033D51D83